MRVAIALESRFDRTPDAAIWAGGWLEYSFWQRYLEVFDEVRVLARVRDIAAAATGARRADGPRVTFCSLPYYVGPWRYALKRWQLARAIRAGTATSDAFILRAPGTISSLVFRRLLRQGRPFGVEVVGDPLDVFGTGGVRSIASPILSRTVPRELRRQCAAACAVAYVSGGILAARYPAGAKAFVTNYSTIDLCESAFAQMPRPSRGHSRRHAERSEASSGRMIADVDQNREGHDSVPGRAAREPFRLLLVGSLEQLYKGPDLLIQAVAECAAKGIDVQARIVGEGRERRGLEEMAMRLGVKDRVTFVGRLPAGDAVRKEMDEADLFVLPSRTEGLPRALLEAMARAAPCIASHVGGIPELLPPDALLPPGDATALAREIAQLAADRQSLARMSARNLETARLYHADVLRPRRRAFYEHVWSCTESWLNGSGRGRANESRKSSGDSSLRSE